MHEVLRVIQERVRSGSRPGDRGDGLRIALSIEGGGMRGSVSAGMALALHELGLTPAFDAVYGASAGAITGAWLLSSEPEKLRGWTDPDYARTLIRWSAMLRRRPVVDVTSLVEVVYRSEFPMDFASVLASPVEYHPLATDAATGESTDLRPLIDTPAELRLALRASASLPFLAGPPVRLRGRRYFDAGVAESIPFRTPLAQGATHILVLRSRRPAAVLDGVATGADGSVDRAADETIDEAVDVAAEANVTAEADVAAESDRDAELDSDAETERAEIEDAASAAGSAATRLPRAPRSIRLLTRTTLRNESQELRTALLTRGPRTAADVARILELEDAGQALMIYPPESVPPVSRLTTDGPMLAAAFESGRQTIHAICDWQQRPDAEFPDNFPAITE